MSHNQIISSLIVGIPSLALFVVYLVEKFYIKDINSISAVREQRKNRLKKHLLKYHTINDIVFISDLDFGDRVVVFDNITASTIENRNLKANTILNIYQEAEVIDNKKQRCKKKLS